jgi:uncharacterized protein YbgA (DUF1722 family)
MHLEARGDAVELVVSDSGELVGERMREFAQERVNGFIADHGGPAIDGYVFKSRSPSCALTSAPTQGRSDHGPGLFAARFAARWPTVPAVEEGGVGRHFVRRLFAAFRLRQLFDPGWSTGELVAFHTAHKLLLFSCDPGKTRQLGALVAGSAKLDSKDAVLGYRAAFAEILATPPSRGREIDTLQHCVGYFDAGSPERERAANMVQSLIGGGGSIDRARTELAAMVRAAGLDYLQGQHYFIVDDAERAALEVR